MSYKKLTSIAISQENVLKLKSLGFAGESYNDVLNELLISALNANMRNRRPTSVLEVGTTKHLSAGAPSAPTLTKRERT